MKEQVFEWLKNAVDLMKDEIPQFVQEYLQWSAASHIMGICFGAFLLIMMIPFFVYVARNKDDYNKEDYCIGSVFAIALLLLFGFSFVCFDTYELVKLKTAPRVYLVERFMKK